MIYDHWELWSKSCLTDEISILFGQMDSLFNIVNNGGQLCKKTCMGLTKATCNFDIVAFLLIFKNLTFQLNNFPHRQELLWIIWHIGTEARGHPSNYILEVVKLILTLDRCFYNQSLSPLNYIYIGWFEVGNDIHGPSIFV